MQPLTPVHIPAQSRTDQAPSDPPSPAKPPSAEAIARLVEAALACGLRVTRLSSTVLLFSRTVSTEGSDLDPASLALARTMFGGLTQRVALMIDRRSPAPGGLAWYW